MLLRNLRLIDGTGAVHAGVDLRVREGRIAEMGMGLAPGAEPVVDVAGASVLPGLIDAHTHLSLDGSAAGLTDAAQRSRSLQAVETAARAGALLRQGVTTARDLGGVGPDVIFAARDAVRAGVVPGPRLLAAGRWMTATGGHGWPIGVEVDGADELRKAVRAELKAGADLIKLMVSGGVVGPGLGPNAVQFDEPQVRVATAEAHGAGLRVSAHAHGAPSVLAAVRGGVDTVEHGTFATEALLEEMVQRGVFLVPTLAVIGKILDRADAVGLEPHTVERAREAAAAHRGTVAGALRAGVRVVAGTDLGSPFVGPDAIHDEIAALVGAGMRPMQALQAATSTAAEALGLGGEAGVVAVGRPADLLIVEGDPLAEIAATRRIRLVMLAGAVVPR